MLINAISGFVGSASDTLDTMRCMKSVLGSALVVASTNASASNSSALSNDYIASVEAHCHNCKLVLITGLLRQWHKTRGFHRIQYCERGWRISIVVEAVVTKDRYTAASEMIKPQAIRDFLGSCLDRLTLVGDHSLSDNGFSTYMRFYEAVVRGRLARHEATDAYPADSHAVRRAWRQKALLAIAITKGYLHGYEYVLVTRSDIVLRRLLPSPPPRAPTLGAMRTTRLSSACDLSQRSGGRFDDPFAMHVELSLPAAACFGDFLCLGAVQLISHLSLYMVSYGDTNWRGARPADDGRKWVNHSRVHDNTFYTTALAMEGNTNRILYATGVDQLLRHPRGNAMCVDFIRRNACYRRAIVEPASVTPPDQKIVRLRTPPPDNMTPTELALWHLTQPQAGRPKDLPRYGLRQPR